MLSEKGILSLPERNELGGEKKKESLIDKITAKIKFEFKGGFVCKWKENLT